MNHMIRLLVAIIGLTLCAWAQDTYQQPAIDHWTVGLFADGFRLSRVSPHVNFIGVGGRAGYYFGRRFALEAEVSYDFERHFNTCLLYTSPSPRD